MREYDKIHKDKVFHNYHADVEYNRMGYGDIKYFMTHRHTLQYMVSDLLIQRRASGRNLLAVEMKRKGNHKNVDNDKNRLKSLVSPSDPYRDDRCVRDTVLGAFIVYSKESTWPVSSRQSAVEHHGSKEMADPLTKPGIVGTFCRAYGMADAIDTFLSDIYAPCFLLVD